MQLAAIFRIDNKPAKGKPPPKGGKPPPKPKDTPPKPKRTMWQVIPKPLKPALTIAMGGLVALGLWVMGPLRWVAEDIGYATDQQFQRVGFKINEIHVQGLDGKPRADVLAAMRVFPGQSILGTDLRDVQARVQNVDWVKEAHVMRLLPDTVYVSVIPRVPFALWQINKRVHVIDDEGRPIRTATPRDYMDLPLVVGDGAQLQARAIIDALADHPNIARHVRAMVFVGERRWNLRLNSGADVMLPELQVGTALAKLERIEAQKPILNVPLDRIDLRVDGKMALRPKSKDEAKPAKSSEPKKRHQIQAANPNPHNPQYPSQGV